MPKSPATPQITRNFCDQSQIWAISVARKSCEWYHSQVSLANLPINRKFCGWSRGTRKICDWFAIDHNLTYFFKIREGYEVGRGRNVLKKWSVGQFQQQDVQKEIKIHFISLDWYMYVMWWIMTCAPFVIVTNPFHWKHRDISTKSRQILLQLRGCIKICRCIYNFVKCCHSGIKSPYILIGTIFLNLSQCL